MAHKPKEYPKKHITKYHDKWMNNGVLFGVVVVQCGGCAKRRGSRSEAKSETCSSTWSTAMGNLGGKGGEREGTEGVGNQRAEVFVDENRSLQYSALYF